MSAAFTTAIFSTPKRPLCFQRIRKAKSATTGPSLTGAGLHRGRPLAEFLCRFLHDFAGLADLMGGRDKMIEKMDKLFATPPLFQRLRIRRPHSRDERNGVGRLRSARSFKSAQFPHSLYLFLYGCSRQDRFLGEKSLQGTVHLGK